MYAYTVKLFLQSTFTGVIIKDGGKNLAHYKLQLQIISSLLYLACERFFLQLGLAGGAGIDQRVCLYLADTFLRNYTIERSENIKATSKWLEIAQSYEHVPNKKVIHKAWFWLITVPETMEKKDDREPTQVAKDIGDKLIFMEDGLAVDNEYARQIAKDYVD